MTTSWQVDHSATAPVWPVAIVGGGPAGCAAAHAAARLGLSGLVIERGAPYRDKACGDMLVPNATAILREFGLRPEDIGSPFPTVELHGSRTLLWRVTYPEEPVWIIPRRRLDQQLRDLLPQPMTVLHAASVTGLAQVGSDQLALSVRLSDGRTIEVRSRTIILAAGAFSPIARDWGLCGRGHIAPSVSAYVEDAAVPVPKFEFRRSAIHGYRWVFPVSDRLGNLGVCALARTNGATLRALGNELAAQTGIAAKQMRWRGGAGSLWSGEGTAWHHDAGILSCGDAAGLVDPVNGEGITSALVSGRAAGAAMYDFLRSGRQHTALSRYSTWVRATFSAKYSRSPARVAWRQLCGDPRVRERAA